MQTFTTTDVDKIVRDHGQKINAAIKNYQKSIKLYMQ